MLSCHSAGESEKNREKPNGVGDFSAKLWARWLCNTSQKDYCM